MSAGTHPQRTLLSLCRWALWLFIALILVTAVFFWFLAKDLQLTRVQEPKTKQAAAARR